MKTNKLPFFLYVLFQVDFMPLLVTAFGSLGLSGYSTYSLLAIEFGEFAAIAAVLTLEVGIIGLSFSQPERELGKVGQFLEDAAVQINRILLVLLLIITNILHRVVALDVVFSTQVFKWVQVLVMGVVIPFLVLITTHRLKKVYNQHYANYSGTPVGYSIKDEVKDVTRQERLEILREIIDRGEHVDEVEQAYRFGVKPVTIKRDLKTILEEEIDKEGF